MSSDSIIALSAAVSAISASVTAYFSYLLISESKKTRKIQESPQIDIFIQPAEDW